MSFSDVGRAWNSSGFLAHAKGKNLSWVRSITIHHTAFPDLSMRREGLVIQHIKNIESYYRGKGWKAGPHLFIDDVDINGMSPLDAPGIHARSFNRDSIGIEVLGNYDKEDPFTGRGWKCWQLTARTTADLLKLLGFKANPKTVLFHRDDPKTRKTCPGTKIKKEWFLGLVRSHMDGTGDVPNPVEGKASNEHIEAVRWQTRAMREETQNLDPEQREELEERLGFIDWRLKQIEKELL